jgi:3-phenylpropionate/cinnamic acid dioxygenase small subunit
MSDPLKLGTDLLFREAHHIDSQKWDDWLALFFADCEYWAPAWKGEHELTNDPDAELSLIYCDKRAALEERVARVRSGRAISSHPLPRTQHTVTNIMLDAASAATQTSIRLLSNWTVHQFKTKPRETEVLFGRYEHELEQRDGRWGIRRKKIVILNDYLPASLDFYNI